MNSAGAGGDGGGGAFSLRGNTRKKVVIRVGGVGEGGSSGTTTSAVTTSTEGGKILFDMAWNLQDEEGNSNQKLKELLDANKDLWDQENIADAVNTDKGRDGGEVTLLYRALENLKLNNAILLMEYGCDPNVMDENSEVCGYESL